MLTLQRRHSRKCPDQDKGPNHLSCGSKRKCPLWACGTREDGVRIRLSLKTRDLQRAAKRLAELEDRNSGRPRKPTPAAVEAFLAQYADKAPETQRKYKRILGYLNEFCRSEDITLVDRVTVEALDRYSAWRGKQRWAWVKEVELLRQFFEFCRDREWTTRNPARSLKRPRIEEANDVVPYTKDDTVAIIAACDGIGRTSYERRRARAMVLVMRYAGLRISDVVTLERGHVQGQRIVKRAVKNGRRIQVEVPEAVMKALEVLPHPKAAPATNRRFFYSDATGLRTLVKAAWRTLDAVFKKAQVSGAHPHRFRHTLASELLGKGGSIEEVAGILGDSPATIIRYYAKWTPEFQGRQDALIRTIHGTDLTQAEEYAVKC